MSTLLKVTILFLGLLVINPKIYSDALNGSISIKIRGMKNLNGQFCFALFNGPLNFPSPSDNLLKSQCISASKSDGMFTFQDLPLGTYAVSVFHDENSDSILNTRIFGIPKESFGFSKNPTVIVSAPKFEDCTVILNSSFLEHEINLKSF